ncbi:hypothetical protein KP509_07G072300 [Ceratopteris richardii]|uniref:Uncharacterized protein n=1 Tax=Ceratopteris richardii TaxID=49495 RepID=A0A8T2UJH8_CERRI|nr:hypothetical protein KP509_07G072300 [Ceratopteris richardii]
MGTGRSQARWFWDTSRKGGPCCSVCSGGNQLPVQGQLMHLQCLQKGAAEHKEKADLGGGVHLGLTYATSITLSQYRCASMKDKELEDHQLQMSGSKKCWSSNLKECPPEGSHNTV